MNQNQYDKIWRINNLYKIRTKERGIIPFKLNRIQKVILNEVKGMKPIRHTTLKSRQVGVSTLWLLWWLDDTMFRPGTITGILAHKLESLQHLTSIIDIAQHGFNGPSGPPVKLDEDNKTRRTFSKINSSIFVSLEIRSTTVHNLHISEWMFCDNERVWASVGATSQYTNITGESTGNGIGNDGYLTYMDAKEGKNEFRSNFFPWYEHKQYRIPLNGIPEFRADKKERELKLDQEQIHFRRQKMTQLKSKFFIEYPEAEEDAFSQSGVSFFNNKKIATLAREAREMLNESSLKEEEDEYKIWEPPQKDHVYCIGADVAEGIGGDYSAFKVICCTCKQEAMAYRAHIGYDTYYRTLDHWGRKYNNALLGVERNNHGHAVLLGLDENCHYPNLYKERVRETRLITNLAKTPPEAKYGWLTTAKNKAQILDFLKFAIEDESETDEKTFRPEYTIHDMVFLSECLTFQRDGIKLSATSGKHDDTIMSSAICYQMFMIAKNKSMRGKQMDILIGPKRESQIF